MSDRNWTAEEYREYLRTGKEPITRPDGVTRIPARADMEAMMRNIPENSGRPAVSPTCCQPGRSIAQEEIEAAWERAEKEDRVMVMDIPTNSRLGERRISGNQSVWGNGLAEPEDKQKKPRKYRNEPITVNGIRFDSKHEANVYEELMLRVKAGELKNVLLQVSFLLPGNIKYVADFVTITPDMRIEGVYDAKSEATKKNRVYINKKKQMKACWGIEIKEI